MKNSHRALTTIVIILVSVILICLGLYFLKDNEGISGIFDKVKPDGDSSADSGVFSAIGNDLSSGKITEDEADAALFLAAFYPGDKGNTYKIRFTEDDNVDMRINLQKMLNSYDVLDKDLQDKLIRVVYPEKYGKITVSELLSGLFRPRKVAAADSDDIYTPMSYGIIPGVSIKTHDVDFMETYGRDFTDIITHSAEIFGELGFAKPSFEVEVVPSSLPEFMSSYSALIPADLGSITDNAVFRIYVDPGRDIDTVEACLVHELFHAWQEQALGSHLGQPETGKPVDWLKETTAIWAVDQVYPDNDFELTFAGDIYTDPSVEYYPMDGMGFYTWYQMFYYFTEIVADKPDIYVADVFAGYRLNKNLDAALAGASGTGRERLNRDFAQMGTALFGGVESSKRFNLQDPAYPVLDMKIKQENKIALNDILTEPGGDWKEHVFGTPGFEYILISIPDDFNERIIFRQNLSMEKDDQMTGMRLAVKRNGQWLWENFPLEPAYHVLDIGGSFDSIDEVLLMLFSAGFEQSEKVQYGVTSGNPEKAKGSITFKWTKEYGDKPAGGEHIENVTVVISENLKRAGSMQDVAETGDQTGIDTNTLQYLAFGENYTIEDMQVEYIYNYRKTDGSNEEKIIGAGSYTYKALDPDAPGAEVEAETAGGIAGESGSAGGGEGVGEVAGEGASIPGLDGLSDILQQYQKIGDELLNSIEQSGDGDSGSADASSTEGGSMPVLSGLAPSLEEMEELMGTFSELKDYMALIPDLPGFDAGNFGMGQNSLTRILIRPDLGSFDLYPTIPPQLSSRKWVKYQQENRYPDPEEPSTTKTETSTYFDKPGEMLPLWFINPDYTEDMDMTGFSAPGADGYEDVGELTDTIKTAYSKLNKINIQKMLNDPWMPFTVDFSWMVEPAPVSAVLTEKAVYDNKSLKAELQSETLTEKGNKINISITVDYGFY